MDYRRKPENLKRTHAGTERTFKLHTENPLDHKGFKHGTLSHIILHLIVKPHIKYVIIMIL